MSARGSRSSVSGKITGTGWRPASSTVNSQNRNPNIPVPTGQKGKKKANMTVGIDELDRIRSQVGATRQSYDMARTAERKTLQEVSKSRVKNWPNTLDNQRLKREQDRIKQLEDQEIERRKLDDTEEQYQEGLRLQQIERTNKMLHDNQDTVKALKSKMLLSDVMYEQDAQKALNSRKQQIEKDHSKHWQEVEKQKMKDYDEKMRSKLEVEYERKMDNAKSISKQLEDYKLSYIKQVKADILEGELIKRQTEEDLEREKLKELARQKKMVEMRQGLKDANKDIIAAREADRQRELEEERKISLHARKRQEVETMKKEREEARFKGKQDERQKMIDRQIELLRAKKTNQEQILNKQVAEAETKANRLFEEQQRRKLELQQAIDRSRQLQIEKRQKEQESNKREEKQFATFWKDRNDELSMAEEQEKEEERQRQIEAANFLKKQSNDKNAKAIRNFQAAQEESLKANAMSDQQEKNFYSYAEKCISEWQAAGKNVKPLILELKNYKKHTL